MIKRGHVGNGICYYKETLRALPIFHLIQEEAGETWRNMLKTFSFGVVGIEVIGDNSDGYLQSTPKFVSEKSGIDLFELGKTSQSNTVGKNEVVVRYKGNFYGPVWK